MILNSYSVKDTERFAKELAAQMPGRIYALAGNLGTGKTTFTQAFLRALDVKSKINSPTFLIMKNYELGLPGQGIKNYERAYHVDCYRLNDPRELLALGFKKILFDSKNIIIIEWADKIKKLLPRETVWLYFNHGVQENERVLTTSLS